MIAYERRRQVRESEHVPGRERQRPFDRALQLADIPRPVVGQQRLGGALGQREPTHPLVTRQEIFGQLQDVFAVAS